MAAVLVVLFGTVAMASAAVRYVNLNSLTHTPPFTSWTTAATNIQDAVDAAIEGDEILVSDGIYQTGGRAVGADPILNRVALDKPLVLRSVNGPEVTVIRGLQRCVYMAEGAVLSGFTLTDGLVEWADGAGVWCESGGAVLTNCVLSGNWCDYGNGGGAFGGTLIDCVVDANGVLGCGGGTYESTLYNCSLRNNLALDDVGGGTFDDGAPVQSPTGDEDDGRGGEDFVTGRGGGAYGGTLINCTVSSNSAWQYGGGAYLGTLNNCILTGNSALEGGGVLFATLSNCTLTGNFAGWSGGGASWSTLSNCNVTHNRAVWFAGGAHSGTLNNCTVIDNSAQERGGGVYGSTLLNCILYYNSAEYEPNYSSSSINYSCTTPLPADGMGNIADGPLFISLAAGNFRLQPDSPCINAGNNAYAPGTNDLDGNPRIVGGTVDMGAYESLPPIPAELVQALVTLVEESSLFHKQPLLATLNAAMASIQRGNSHSAVGQLHAFQRKVSAQVTASAFATELIAAAGEVIAALDRDNSRPGQTVETSPSGA